MEEGMSRLAEIFSCGGGTQSAAISALIVQGRIPKPDYVCIVDTERERATTWQYLDAVLRPALASVGLEIHRIRKSEWGSKPPHGFDYLSHNGKTVLLPAFTNQTDEVGKLPGFCSKTWKVETQERYCRKAIGIPAKLQKRWIGFSLDETRRATRMMRSEDYQAGKIWFPLIHGIPLRRQGAIAVVKAMGWPDPPRSACWNCSNQSDPEWRDLKENSPDEFRAACELEKEVQKIDPFAWFHSSCIPLSEVDFSLPDVREDDRACSSGGCFL
jgi:hypothetical protein